MITQKELEHLSELARLTIKSSEEGKLLKDLSKILGHFEELKEIDTQNVPPMTSLRLAEAGSGHAKAGGTFGKNVFRTDEINENRLPKDRAVEQFPEKEKDFLKIPPVFSAEGGSASGGE